MLVLDASVAVDLCVARVGDASHAALGDDELVAPPLLWSEVPSVLHELRSRGEISEDLAGGALARLTENVIGIREVRPENLTKTAWDIATSLGWAKTYDAEYLATAQLLSCRLVTVDHRLRRGADRFGFVVTPDELH